MTSLYKKELIADIQKAIHNGSVRISYYESYEDVSKIHIGRIEIKLYTNPSGKPDYMMYINDPSVDSSYLKDWHAHVPLKLMSRDCRNDFHDMLGHIPFINVEYDIVDTLGNTHTLKCLIRDLHEVNDCIECGDAEDTLIKQYGNIKMGDKYYTVIKICNKDDIMGFASEKMYGESSYTFVYDMPMYDDDEETNDQPTTVLMSDIREIDESEALF